MKIQVENLGAIHKGEVSLDKNLIIFTGPNNSGKSYMAYLIYGVMKDMREIAFQFKHESITKEPEILNKAIDTHILSQIYQSKKGVITDFIREYITNNTAEYFASNSLSTSLHIDIGDYKFWFKENSKKFIKNKILEEYEQIFFKNKNHQELLVLFLRDLILNLSHRENVKNNLANQLFLVYCSRLLITKQLTDKQKIHFFPAERPAISILGRSEVERKSREQDVIKNLFLQVNNNQATKESLSSILDKKINAAPSYPLAINDYIYFVNGLEQTVKQKSEFGELADEIERMLMQGRIGVSKYGGIEYTPDGMTEPLAIHMSSSLVKSLSGLVLYIRHAAESFDTIIIDEPEVNLHPDNQRIVARVIAKIVNSGFRVILSTHSDYFIKEVNNLIMLNKANENQNVQSELIQDLAKQGYDKDCFLKPEGVGVYYFNDNTIQELEVDELGFDIESIEKELDKINYASEHIYNTLFNQ